MGTATRTEETTMIKYTTKRATADEQYGDHVYAAELERYTAEGWVSDRWYFDSRDVDDANDLDEVVDALGIRCGTGPWIGQLRLIGTTQIGVG